MFIESSDGYRQAVARLPGYGQAQARYRHAAGHCNAQSVTRLGAADNSLFFATLQPVFSLQCNNL